MDHLAKKINNAKTYRDWEMYLPFKATQTKDKVPIYSKRSNKKIGFIPKELWKVNQVNKKYKVHNQRNGHTINKKPAFNFLHHEKN